ncbi:MAG: LemA family protein [Alphaproteobacteria bacterium]|nr:LemA family protein [Alphaproteobacteria bacterium]
MWTTIAIVAVIILYIVAVYNGLVARRVQAREAWATIDTQLKRRYDLIPNLVNAVKGAAKHEKGTLESVIAARGQAMSASGVADKSVAENQLTGALKHIFALSESYPALRANENFLELQQELTDTETKIQAARQFYNTVVMSLNTQIQQFPSSIVASLFKFVPEKFFELDEEEKAAVKKAPKVEF